MAWRALLFIVVPFVELWLLLQIGALLGLWPTLALVIGTAFIGSFLAKREGLRVLRQWQGAIVEGRVPEEGITSSLLVVVGAVLLITPGVLTDALGIALLVPYSRRAIAGALESWLRRRIERSAQFVDVRVVTPDRAYARRRVVDVDGVVVEDREVVIERPQRGKVIEGEVVSSSTRPLPRLSGR